MAGGPMDRRGFLGKLPVVAGAAAGAGALLAGGCAGAAFVVPRQVGGRLVVPRSELRGDGVFVAHPGDPRPIFLARADDGSLTAVHARCTHRGCQPDAVAGRLVCPCHGSEFTLDGAVLEGPADTPLPRYEVVEEDGSVVILLDGGSAGHAGAARVRRGSMALLAALLLPALLIPAGAAGQVDTTLAQGGIYDRPFITGMGGTSIGGYLEGNTNWFVEDGVGEGLSMELRRFNVFLFSSISPRIRFLSELEFEHGTEEIALETALVDVRIRPSLVLRGGIILPPIGYLNQNHDSPKWNWVDRPLVTTEIIPSTLSEVGGGVYGRVGVGGSVVSYDLYLTNGLGDGIVENDVGRTHVPAGKREEQFAEDNNGSPAVSARLGWRLPGLGELGLSWYGATYNTFRVEGEEVDERRRVDLFALDVGGSVDVGDAVGPLAVRGEAAWARVDVPGGLSELFGGAQWGAHVDLTLPAWRPRISGYDGAVLAADLRIERVDFNTGRFASTGGAIGDEVTAVVPGLSFRPGDETVFRVNYRYAWITDFVGNEPARLAGWQLGVATYF